MSDQDEAPSTWARLSSTLWMNEKMRKFSKVHPTAAILWVYSISYSANQLTDGYVSDFVAKHFLGGSDDDINQLIKANFAARKGDGYQIHDYEEWNRSAEQVAEMKKARIEAGKRGADARWHPKDNQPWQKDGKSHSTCHGKSYGTSHGKWMADTDTDTDTDTDFFSSKPSSQKPIPITEWKPGEEEKEKIYESHHVGHEDGDCTLAGMIQWWTLNRPGSKRTPAQWRALTDGWFDNPRSARKAHKHTWLCEHSLAAAHLTRDEASDHTRLLEYIAIGLNKGYSPKLALSRARKVCEKETR